MNTIKIKLGLIWCGLMISLSSVAHVDLKSPKGGETFTPGETVKIEWEITVQHDTKNWDLYFSSDGGNTYEPLESDIEVGTLSFVWTVPSTPSKQARIKIVQDNTGGDYSDESGDFTIAGTSTAAAESVAFRDIYLSPNPSFNLVRINSEKSNSKINKVVVIDYRGRQMYSLRPLTLDRENDMTVDVSGWPMGLYFVLIFTDRTIEERKLIVL